MDTSGAAAWHGGDAGSNMGFIYFTSAAVRDQVRNGADCKKRSGDRRCYHHMGMKPQTIGRALGIGLRVAGRIAGQSLAAGVESAGAQPAAVMHTPEAGDAATSMETRGMAKKTKDARSAGQAAGETTKGVARGVGGFLRPFRRVGGIVWLEVTGSFFFLFVLAAGISLWRTRPSHFYGPYDKNFLAAAGIMVVFFYLGARSFWRARRR
jgi:hypothetical protein